MPITIFAVSVTTFLDSLSAVEKMLVTFISVTYVVQ